MEKEYIAGRKIYGWKRNIFLVERVYTYISGIEVIGNIPQAIP